VRQAVECGRLRSGILYECVRAGVPFVLAGSLRDDGPLPDTITDMNAAQDAYAAQLKGAGLVLCLGSMLHSIATGNMLPSWVKIVCVDINPAVATKVSDRGTGQAVGVVADVGLFLDLLSKALHMKRAYTDEHAASGVHAELPEIETWPNQYADYEIEIVQPEFTSVCPKTGLPDFGKLVLRYVPDKLCLELKSYKMYLNAYRNLGIFQENVVNRVLQDVVKAAKPKFATVIGEFAPRGGLSTIVTATWSRSQGSPVESAELIAILREVRERVRARNPRDRGGRPRRHIALPDLLPLLHARDAALGKVAAIGTVNPRSGGLLNAMVQGWKRFVARVLDWHVREQVEFNRKIVAYADAALEALRESNRALSELGGRAEHQRSSSAIEGDEMKDIRDHWASWRAEWEHKLAENEVQFLRSVADLQGGFPASRDPHGSQPSRPDAHPQRRFPRGAGAPRLRYSEAPVGRSGEDAHRDRAHHPFGAASGAAARANLGSRRARPRRRPGAAILRPLRWHSITRASPSASAAPEEYVTAGQQFYLPYFEGCRKRARYRLRPRRIPQDDARCRHSRRGIELSAESVASAGRKVWTPKCRRLPLPGGAARRLARRHFLLAGGRAPAARPTAGADPLVRQPLAPGGVIAIETPNPECLAIFATHFLPRSHAHAPGAASAADLLPGGIRRRQHRSAPALTREGHDAVAEFPAGRFPRRLFRSAGLRRDRAEAVGHALARLVSHNFRGSARNLGRTDEHGSAMPWFYPCESVSIRSR
jgi:7-cyano-7-deazaguanine reductase